MNLHCDFDLDNNNPIFTHTDISTFTDSITAVGGGGGFAAPENKPCYFWHFLPLLREPIECVVYMLTAAVICLPTVTSYEGITMQL